MKFYRNIRLHSTLYCTHFTHYYINSLYSGLFYFTSPSYSTTENIIDRFSGILFHVVKSLYMKIFKIMNWNKRENVFVKHYKDLSILLCFEFEEIPQFKICNLSSLTSFDFIGIIITRRNKYSTQRWVGNFYLNCNY